MDSGIVITKKTQVFILKYYNMNRYILSLGQSCLLSSTCGEEKKVLFDWIINSSWSELMEYLTDKNKYLEQEIWGNHKAEFHSEYLHNSRARVILKNYLERELNKPRNGV